MRVHGGADEGKDCCERASQDDGRRDSTSAIDGIRIHEVLKKALHDLGNTSTEWEASENRHYPVYRRGTCPKRQ